VGLILDSSVAIAAERSRDTVQALLQRILATAGDQGAALSAAAVVELVHGIHRADSAERRARREAFVEELLSIVAIYPLTTDVARLAGKRLLPVPGLRARERLHQRPRLSGRASGRNGWCTTSCAVSGPDAFSRMGGVLCRPAPAGRCGSRGVNDPPPARQFRPQARPRGSFTPRLPLPVSCVPARDHAAIPWRNNRRIAARERAETIVDGARPSIPDLRAKGVWRPVIKTPTRGRHLVRHITRLNR
jgi:predicted nucleic acid-binding protein